MRRIRRLGRALCGAGGVVGTLDLAGWASGNGSLVVIIPGRPIMMPNTAVALVLLGLAGALAESRRTAPRTAALGAAAVVLAIGVATLAEYVTGVDLRIDEIIVRTGTTPFPGRPSPMTALALTLLATAAIVRSAHSPWRARLSECLILAAGFMAFVTLLGHLFSAGALYHLRDVSVYGVALATSLALLSISAGLLLVRPEQGLTSAVFSPGPGGVLLRRLAFPAMVVPALLGLLALEVFAEQGSETTRLALATLIAAVSFVTLPSLMLIAVHLNRAHVLLEASRAQAQRLIQQAADGVFVADTNGRYTDVNEAGCRMLGMTRDEIVGRNIVDLIRPDEHAKLRAAREAQLAGAAQTAEWHLQHKAGRYVPVEVSAKILPDGRWYGIVRDITDRRAAEDAMHRANAMIEGIVSIAADAIISIDDDQRITIFNRGAEEIFGWQAAEVIGKPVDLLIPERFRAAHRRHVVRFAAEPTTSRRLSERSAPILGRCKDGREFRAEAAISKLRLGERWVFTVVLRDITARVAMERALREAHDLLQNVVESATAYAIVALDVERRIVLWNAGARRNYGYSSEEILGRSVDMLHSPDDLASGAPSALYARALDEGGTEATLHQRRKDGSELVARMTVCRRVIDGQPVGYLVISRDVTVERRRAEQEGLLAELGALSAASLDQTRVLDEFVRILVRDFADACVVDRIDNPEDVASTRDRRVIHRDPEGYSAGTTLERHPLQVSTISMPLQARGLSFGTVTFLRADPALPYDELDVPFVEEVGRRLALAIDNARLFEITGRAVAARDQVLAVVAHDLRNPLSAVGLAAELLARASDDSVRSTALRIRRALAHATRLIDDLLDVTRIERPEGLAVDAKPSAPEKVVRGAVDIVESAAADAGVALDVAIEPQLPRAAMDDGRMVQALGNLIGNAVKFAPRGGRVRVIAARRGDEVVFTVTDDGPGIAPEHLAHLFDRFWQAKRADRRGAGLGLAIAKGIVEAHGGRIWAESVVGHGSEFSIALPVLATATKPSSVAAPPA
jgi:PAS domain S-box-containing protein